MTDLPPPDDTELPDQPVEPDEPTSGGTEVCVPLSAVAVNENENEATPPSEGDSISVTLEGKATRIEGDKVYFIPATANGEPIPAEEPAEPAMDDMAAEGDSLKALSQSSSY